MYRPRLISGLLLFNFSLAILAQPVPEELVSDPDEIAADELVRELREASNKYDPESVLSITEEEALQIIEQCELYEMVDTELTEVELGLEETLSQDEMLLWRERFGQTRRKALHDCCQQQSVSCFQ